MIDTCVRKGEMCNNFREIERAPWDLGSDIPSIHLRHLNSMYVFLRVCVYLGY